MSHISDCQAKNPLTCPYHGLDSLDRMILSPNTKFESEEAEREEILSHYMTKNGLTVDDLKEYEECLSRPKITEENKSKFVLNEDSTVLRQCERCGHIHPFSKKPRPDDYYSTSRNFKILNSMLTDIRKGKIESKVPNPVHIKYNPRFAVLFENASNLFTKYNLSREELVIWYVCGRKQAYNSHALAQAVAHQQNGKIEEPSRMLSVYQCPTDGKHYHIGKRSLNFDNSSWKSGNTVKKAKKTFEIYEQHGRLRFPLIPTERI